MASGKRKQIEAKSLYYITHKDNIPSILRYGVLSHAKIEERGIKHQSIYDTEIVSNRRGKETPDGRSLWGFANVYFQPRNPMMYRVIHERGRDHLAVVALKKIYLTVLDCSLRTGMQRTMRQLSTMGSGVSRFSWKLGVSLQVSGGIPPMAQSGRSWRNV